MSKKRPWQYANAKNQMCGIMKCSLCGKMIIVGQYRFRESEEAYYAHAHRACVPIDQQNYWLEQEYKESLRKEDLKGYLQACIDFKQLWNTVALDDEIADMEEYLK